MNRATVWIVFCVAASLLLALAGPLQAETWNVASDFSITNGNPNDRWTYGHVSWSGGGPDMSTGQVQAYDEALTADAPVAGLHVWRDTGVSDPNVGYNPTSNSALSGWGITWNPGDFGVGPYIYQASGASWTAPASGLYDISASFTKNQSWSAVGVNAYVYHDASQLFSGNTGTTNLSSVSYNGQVSMLAGERLTFLAGPDITDPSLASYATLGVTITSVPEPGTVVLLATGLLGLLAYGWRKRK